MPSITSSWPTIRWATWRRSRATASDRRWSCWTSSSGGVEAEAGAAIGVRGRGLVEITRLGGRREGDGQADRRTGGQAEHCGRQETIELEATLPLLSCRSVL